ncbi:hypothetical protein PROFUN_11846 [Planoprotostelium fungivorum]|uniref:Mitochondrial carrier protein n=1 Tax=Planoprotostelium fungivorum TaxID=1890364 RepID=A0A2P6N9A5_9EUKA|nr:hypothetical protein PROFUN_11846 [Planoprotostelium fungivorum]
MLGTIIISRAWIILRVVIDARLHVVDENANLRVKQKKLRKDSCSSSLAVGWLFGDDFCFVKEFRELGESRVAEMDENKRIKFPTGVKEVLSGTFAGLVGTVIGHPLDLVKVRLQTQNRYKGAIDCLIRVAREEGFRHGLYRGLIPPLISLTFLNSLSFGAYSYFKKQLQIAEKQYIPNWQEDRRFHPEYFLAGLLTGTFSGVFSTPFEMVKVRMQLDNVGHRLYRGSAHCATSLIRNYGIKSWYTGYWVNTCRESLFCCVYFGVYEHAKAFLSSQLGTDHGKINPLAVCLAGGASGMLAWVVSFPLDSIKNNIQGQSMEFLKDNNTTKQTFSKVTKHLWTTRGVGGFYSGVLPSVARAFVVSGSRFSAYEFAYTMLSKHVEGNDI